MVVMVICDPCSLGLEPLSCWGKRLFLWPVTPQKVFQPEMAGLYIGSGGLFNQGLA